MTITTAEIESQPATWAAAMRLIPEATRLLARPGERVLAIGCGTSVFVAESFAALYLVILWFEQAFDRDWVRACVRHALPTIEGLTVALPPTDGPFSEAAALGRRR